MTVPSPVQPVGLATGERTPLHQAIDLLTATTIDVQRLRRTLARSGCLDGDMDTTLTAIEASLHTVGAVLTARRDTRGAAFGDGHHTSAH
jgi:hypothetical protein